MRRLFVGPLSVLRLAYLLENCRLLCAAKMRELAALPMALTFLSAHLTAVSGEDETAGYWSLITSHGGFSSVRLLAAVRGQDAEVDLSACAPLYGDFMFCA